MKKDINNKKAKLNKLFPKKKGDNYVIDEYFKKNLMIDMVKYVPKSGLTNFTGYFVIANLDQKTLKLED